MEEVIRALHRSETCCGGLTLAGCHLPSHSLTPLHRTEGENTIQKFVGQDKDSKITYQLQLKANRLVLGEINLLPIKTGLDSEKQTN